jgi:O-antigen/teichoic acid export membrane protein
MSSDRKFYKQLFHFIAGNGLTTLLGFISFPVLTRVLPKDKYGILGLVTTTMLLLVALSKDGTSNGIIRYYHLYREMKETRSVFVSTIIFKGILFSLITVICYIILLPIVKNIINIPMIIFYAFNYVSLFIC